MREHGDTTGLAGEPGTLDHHVGHHSAYRQAPGLEHLLFRLRQRMWIRRVGHGTAELLLEFFQAVVAIAEAGLEVAV